MLPIALIETSLAIAELLLRVFSPVRTLGIVWSLPGLFVGPLVGGALVIAANDSFRGIRPRLGRSLSTATSRYGSLFTTNLLGAALTIVSLVAFPYFAVRWTFDQQAVMIEGKRNWAALDASSSIVRGHWWRVCGYMTLVLAPTAAFWLTWIAIYLGPGVNWLVYFVGQLAWYVVFAFASPFIVAIRTLLYHDLRARYLGRQPASEFESSGV